MTGTVRNGRSAPISRGLRVAIWAAGVAAVCATGFFGYRWLAGVWKQEEIPTLTVTRTAFVRKVSADGNLRAVKATKVVAPRRSRSRLKIAWLAPDGSHVKKGDVLVRFDPTEMERTLIDGKAARDAADSKIAKERVMVSSALRNRDRTTQLSELELEQTRAFQRKDTLIFSRNQIIEADIDERLSTARKDHAGRAKDIERSLSKSKLALLEIERRAADQKVEQAKEELEGLTLTAPHDGILVLKRDWRGEVKRVGDMVWSRQQLAEIPLLDDMEAEVFVLEADASGLEVGRAATVVLEAHPETTYKAEIKQVETLAKPRVQEVPVQYFAVTLKLERTDTAIMKPGQRVRATLILDDQEALVIPRQAVFEDDGKPIVYRKVADGGKDGHESVPVKLGASSPGRVVIESGLEDGDRIYLRDPTRPRDQGEDDDSSADTDKGPVVGAP